jgi:hypothetical protein
MRTGQGTWGSDAKRFDSSWENTRVESMVRGACGNHYSGPPAGAEPPAETLRGDAGTIES